MTEEQERMDKIRACFEFDTKLRCRFLDDEGQSYSDGYYCTLKREEGKNGKKWPKHILPGEFYKIPEWCPLELAPPKDWERLLLVKTLSKEDKKILDDFFVRMYFSEEKKVK